MTDPILPRLVPISILQQFGIGRVSCYDYASKMPEDLKVYFGRRVFLKYDLLLKWLENGGSQGKTKSRRLGRKKEACKDLSEAEIEAITRGDDTHNGLLEDLNS